MQTQVSGAVISPLLKTRQRSYQRASSRQISLLWINSRILDNKIEMQFKLLKQVCKDSVQILSVMMTQSSTNSVVLSHVEFENNEPVSLLPSLFLPLYNTRMLFMPLHLLSIKPPTTSFPFFRLIYIAVTPSIGSPATDNFIFSQAPFLLSAITPSLLISPFYCTLVLHRPSSVPLSLFKSLTSIFLPPSIRAIFLLCGERRSYFIGGGRARGYYTVRGATSHFKIWF